MSEEQYHEWLKQQVKFYQEMGRKPQEGHLRQEYAAMGEAFNFALAKYEYMLATSQKLKINDP